jgi:hypothetical protein
MMLAVSNEELLQPYQIIIDQREKEVLHFLEK